MANKKKLKHKTDDFVTVIEGYEVDGEAIQKFSQSQFDEEETYLFQDGIKKVIAYICNYCDEGWYYTYEEALECFNKHRRKD